MRVERVNFARVDAPQKRIFWHADLPPLEAELVDEYRVIARSERIEYRFDRRTELWHRCVDSLRENLEHRIGQELDRMGSHTGLLQGAVSYCGYREDRANIGFVMNSSLVESDDIPDTTKFAALLHELVNALLHD